MRIRWKLGSTLLGLSLAGLVVVGASGCGGETGPETGDAVVVPPPAASPADPAADAVAPAEPAEPAAPAEPESGSTPTTEGEPGGAAAAD